MIESPLLQELVAERLHQAVLRILRKRFRSVPPDLVIALERVLVEEKLYELVEYALTCIDLNAFRDRVKAS